jgi:hypothetical protein
MGQNLDDAHVFYKRTWLTNMTAVLGPAPTDLNRLISPQTAEDKARATRLEEEYKLDPKIMKEVDERYGPLEWRLPNAHAVYWAYVGLKHSKNERLIDLRRMIYQSLHQAVLLGRVIQVGTNLPPTFGPNLDLVERANAAYEEWMGVDPAMRDAIRSAHRNYLREIVFILYSYNRIAQAQHYFDLARQKYDDAFPPDLDLTSYALGNIAANMKTLTQSQTQAIIQGVLSQSYQSRAIGEEDEANGYYAMAQQIYRLYGERAGGEGARLGLPAFRQMEESVLDTLLDPENGLVPELSDRLRRSLNLPPSAPTPKKDENK